MPARRSGLPKTHYPWVSRLPRLKRRHQPLRALGGQLQGDRLPAGDHVAHELLVRIPHLVVRLVGATEGLVVRGGHQVLPRAGCGTLLAADYVLVEVDRTTVDGWAGQRS